MKRRLDTPGNVVALVRATHIHALTVLARAHTGRPAAMAIMGLDLHKRETQLCRQRPDGRRESAERGGEARPAGGNALVDNAWGATHLERLGHTVIVADPNFAPMYATRSRHLKTDKRDAHALMAACRQGTYRPAYRLSAARRHRRAELIVRDTLVHTRTRCIAVCKTSVRRDGLRVPSGASETIAARIAALDLARQAPTLGAELAPLLAQLPALTTAISAARL